jgi:hypothetical protein
MGNCNFKADKDKESIAGKINLYFTPSKPIIFHFSH